MNTRPTTTIDNAFHTLLDIARRAEVCSPNTASADVARYHLKGMMEEVDEVQRELKDRNVVHLEDELSDILWDYVSVLAACERAGLIDGAQYVLTRGIRKYTERLPAIERQSDDMWTEIKDVQKQRLLREHEERYEST